MNEAETRTIDALADELFALLDAFDPPLEREDDLQEHAHRIRLAFLERRIGGFYRHPVGHLMGRAALGLTPASDAPAFVRLLVWRFVALRRDDGGQEPGHPSRPPLHFLRQFLHAQLDQLRAWDGSVWPGSCQGALAFLVTVPDGWPWREPTAELRRDLDASGLAWRVRSAALERAKTAHLFLLRPPPSPG